jgi:hypothetical protein
MKDWDRYMREHDFQLSAVGSDLPMIEYIIATDDDGDLVNEKDEKWLPESEQPEDWLAWLTQEEFEDMTIHRNCTALHYAALLRDVHLCKLILDHPRFQEANAHCKLPHYNEGWTALHIACAIGIQDIACCCCSSQSLLQSGIETLTTGQHFTMQWRVDIPKSSPLSWSILKMM